MKNRWKDGKLQSIRIYDPYERLEFQPYPTFVDSIVFHDCHGTIREEMAAGVGHQRVSHQFSWLKQWKINHCFHIFEYVKEYFGWFIYVDLYHYHKHGDWGMVGAIMTLFENPRIYSRCFLWSETHRGYLKLGPLEHFGTMEWIMTVHSWRFLWVTAMDSYFSEGFKPPPRTWIVVDSLRKPLDN